MILLNTLLYKINVKDYSWPSKALVTSLSGSFATNATMSDLAHFLEQYKLTCHEMQRLLDKGIVGRGRRPHTLFDSMDASTQYFCPQNPCDTYITYVVLVFSAYSLT